METDREEDRKMLMQMPKEQLIEVFLLQMRNLWAVDGLYFLGIEEKFGTENATDIDKNVWEVMGKLEARRLKEIIKIESNDIPSIMNALKHTSWSLDLENKEIAIEKDRGVFRNKNCRVQNTRMKKGLSEFPCKHVRWGYLKSFAKELNPDIEVKCNVCPPDEHPENLWCDWEFEIKKKDR
jgi:hypothetical protein